MCPLINVLFGCVSLTRSRKACCRIEMSLMWAVYCHVHTFPGDSKVGLLLTRERPVNQISGSILGITFFGPRVGRTVRSDMDIIILIYCLLPKTKYIYFFKKEKKKWVFEKCRVPGNKEQKPWKLNLRKKSLWKEVRSAEKIQGN